MGLSQLLYIYYLLTLNAGWEWSHAFFVAMGGFHFYNKDGPMHPLSPTNILELVGRGHLVPPTAEEISDKSKGDALSKCVAIVQTLWFVAQCFTRHVKHLPITNLEVMTLAYTVITVAMYAAWWAKPLNVSCAVRVPEEDIQEEETLKHNSIWVRVDNYVMGNLDDYVDLRICKRVPTFWAGKADERAFWAADIIALVVAMAFGAVHCFAWHYEFRSHLKQRLWRGSAIVIMAAPPAFIVALFAAAFVDAGLHGNGNMFENVLGIIFAPIGVIYIAARLALIVLSFTSLRGLPFGAYQTIRWTTFIPHI